MQFRCNRCRFNPWFEKFSGGGHGDPPQYSCLKNPMDKGDWEAVVYRVTQNQTWLKRLSTCLYIYILQRAILGSASLTLSILMLAICNDTWPKRLWIEVYECCFMNECPMWFWMTNKVNHLFNSLKSLLWLKLSWTLS